MKYNIKDADGNITNTITADADFVEANFEHYELWVASAPEEFTQEDIEAIAKLWRDGELQRTDKAAQTPDWPNRDNILTYRVALRDWPATDNFPDTRPEVG